MIERSSSSFNFVQNSIQDTDASGTGLTNEITTNKNNNLNLNPIELFYELRKLLAAKKEDIIMFIIQ